ncbi:hypothetical protein NSK_008730 [Nannochloropsis salina CCMP1776]|uniref:Uncharacterized protein n=1 Tax=Nannochloropsis salina CCMP1776 TaxID=1027361 RepID=A0A4D9CLG0_9STRA|nr:hypothetical protein NSK_008730 [Nannochloropsis salina CCMP1776]|eukprot:TFJ79922.1 hypothetical protein NSK_008730 [Nannochloropsis salina CCMP1776]
MGKAKKTRKYAVMKKQISPKDPRLKENIEKAKKKAEAAVKAQRREVEAVPTGMFFKYNTSLGPPFRVLGGGCEGRQAKEGPQENEEEGAGEGGAEGGKEGEVGLEGGKEEGSVLDFSD